jgi:hypothetical protein
MAYGGAIGFLFGAPTPKDGRESPTFFDEQTNLEEIAQWLSRLIVVGTLIESGIIIDFLRNAGREFARTIGHNDELWSGVGSACIIYFGILAFLQVISLLATFFFK